MTVHAVVAMAIGVFAVLAPNVLIESVKVAEPSAAAEVMARTVGVLIFTSGLLAFLVRGDGSSPTLKSILVVNLGLQLAMLPIDPLAYANGTFHTVGSFLPNTILHVLLASGFAHCLVQLRREEDERATVAAA